MYSYMKGKYGSAFVKAFPMWKCYWFNVLNVRVTGECWLNNKALENKTVIQI